MSGVFMDGGGHDHGGHSMHGGGGGGDGGNFMDGGNHDHGGHAMHHSGGGDGGNFLSNLLGYNDHAGHHSFLSHLLGLDHDAHHGGGHHGGGEGMAPSQSPIWTSALQGLKLQHALEGVNISINGWFFFFYVLCIFWLFAIYWIRHHEPLANAVLGRGAAKYETAAADRRIIDNCRDATPIRTSQNQALYAPMPAQFVDPAAQQAIAAAAFNPAAAQAAAPSSLLPPNAAPAISMPGQSGVAVPQNLATNLPMNSASNATQQMASYYNQATPFGAPTMAQPIAGGPAQLIATPMPLATGGAQRLKMIINK